MKLSGEGQTSRDSLLTLKSKEIRDKLWDSNMFIQFIFA